MKRYALIGDPVEGSASPAMHRAAFEAGGIAAEYTALHVAREELPETFPGLRESFDGLNVTIPLKEAILPLLDEVAPEADRAGSVNTVALEDGRAVGHSTDGPGFLAALEGAGTDAPGRVLILGTGGAARAVAAELLERGGAVTVAGRNAEAGARLARDLGIHHLHPERTGLAEAVDAADLLVNATPIGGPGHEDASPLPDEVSLRRELTVFDLVYRPRRTILLERARAAGCRTIEGVEMLIEQGARSFEIWTGENAAVEAMRAAALAALEETAPAQARGGR